MKHKKILLFLTILFLSISVFTPIPQVQATWYNSSWLYRKSHVVNSASFASTNYQVKIVVVNGSSSDSGNTVYIDNKTESDFGDIRFTDNDETTLLDYWIEETNSGDNATFWVEVADNLNSTSATIYVYYGASGQSTTSNGTNTFLYFEDFGGASLDSDWVVGGGTVPVGSGVATLDNDDWIYTNTTNFAWGYNHSVIAYSNATEEDTFFVEFTDGSSQTVPNEALQLYDSDWERPHIWDEFSVRSLTGGANTSDCTYATGTGDFRNTFFNYEIQYFNGSADFYHDNTFLANRTTYMPSTSLGIGFAVWDSSAESTLEVDWVLIRKCLDPEPTHGAWGSEETENTAPTNDACDSTTTFRLNTYAWVNVTVTDTDLVADLKEVEIQVNTTGDAETFSLNWTQSTGNFAEVSDSSSICTLHASSTRVNVDTDTDKITFYFKFIGSPTAGSCDVKATTTDDSDATDTDTYSSEFTLEVAGEYYWVIKKKIGSGSSDWETFSERTVSVQGTMANSTAYDFGSATGNCSGTLYYGTTTYSGYWGTLEFSIGGASSFSHTTPTGTTYWTTLSKFTSGSYYILSCKQSGNIIIEKDGSTGWKANSVEFLSTTGTLKMDFANWIVTGEPYSFTFDGVTYDRGSRPWTWDYTNSIFEWTFSLDHAANYDMSMSWEEPQTGDIGNVYIPPLEPIIPEIPEAIEEIMLEPEGNILTQSPYPGIAFLILAVSGAVVYDQLLKKRRGWGRKKPKKLEGKRSKPKKPPTKRKKARSPVWRKRKTF